MIAQTAHFAGVTPERLYHAYLSSTEHSAMTNGTRPARFYRPAEGEVAEGHAGDALHAFGVTNPDGTIQYLLTATILQLIPPQVIVLAWKTLPWTLALDPHEVSDLDSIVVLTFKNNFVGAEIQLVQVNVPEYTVRLPDTGEVGPLQSIVNTHWNVLYWEPMRAYFQSSHTLHQ
jgi:hypothetical protein